MVDVIDTERVRRCGRVVTLQASSRMYVLGLNGGRPRQIVPRRDSRGVLDWPNRPDEADSAGVGGIGAFGGSSGSHSERQP